jgi:hypothetical protein
MERRSFLTKLTSLVGGGAFISLPASAQKIEHKNPLKGNNEFVRVYMPVKTGDRLICSEMNGDYPSAWPVKEGEEAHCVAKMDAPFEFYNAQMVNEELVYIKQKGPPPPSQIVVVDKI